MTGTRVEVLADLGDAGPYAVAELSSGEVVVTLVRTGEIAVLTPHGVQRVEVGEQPGQVAVVDDRIWCTVTGADQVVRVDPTASGWTVGRRVELPGGPYGLASDVAGLWVSLLSTHELARVAWSGEVVRTALPDGSFPAMVTVGTDDHPWVALNQSSTLAWIVDGRVDLVALPDGAAPVGLAAGPDGVWAADIGAGRILRVRASGPVDSWRLAVDSRPHAVVDDPDGGCWFTEWGTNRLGRIDASGELSEHDLSDHGSEPHGLLLTDDGIVVALESGAVLRLAPAAGDGSPG